MKRLDRKTPLKEPHNVQQQQQQQCAHRLCGSKQDVFQIICRMKSYLSAVTSSTHLQFRCVVTLYTTACKSIKQSYCADFYVWALKYSGSLYLS